MFVGLNVSCYSTPILYTMTLHRYLVALICNMTPHCYSLPLLYTVALYRYSVPLLYTVPLLLSLVAFFLS